LKAQYEIEIASVHSFPLPRIRKPHSVTPECQCSTA